MTRSLHVDDARDRGLETPPAERPPTGEAELARGRVAQTPFAMINWVAAAIGLFALLVLGVVVAAYFIA